MKRTRLRSVGRKVARDRAELAVSRRLVLERSESLCEIDTPEICGTFGGHPGSDLHHVLRRSQGGSNDPDNLLWICQASHRYLHEHPQVAYVAGWLRRGLGGTASGNMGAQS